MVMIMNGRKELREALYRENEVHKCPVCEQTLFPCEGSHLICEVCGWEDDWQQLEDPDMDGGANILSLDQYRRWAIEKGIIKTNEKH